MARQSNAGLAVIMTMLLQACADAPTTSPVPTAAPAPVADATSGTSTPAITPTPAPTPAPAPATSTPAPATPAPSTPAQEPEIVIERIDVGNPLVVRGRARTFENSVSVRLRDARGALIRETFVTAVGDMGQRNPFEASLWVTRDPGGRVIVEALEYSAKDGSERSLARREVGYTIEPIAVELFRTKDDCTTIVPLRRTMPKSVSMARLLVEALIAEGGPFPKGSAVRSVNLRDGVLTVDFNDRLQNVGGSCAARSIRTSVERTLRALPSVREVVITAAGSRDLALQP